MNNPFAYQHGDAYRYRPPDDPQRMADARTLDAIYRARVSCPPCAEIAQLA